MKDRVKFEKPSFLSIDIDWEKLVLKPMDEGDYAEAFASADGILDGEIESLLRQIYSDFKCQDLINELHNIRSKTSFEGLTMLGILKNKTVVSDVLCERVLNFKKARNLVLHNIKREYALVESEELEVLSDQKQYDDLAALKATEWLNEAFAIFNDFQELSSTVNQEDFFSRKFYRENPRGRLTKQIFPRKSKKKKKAGDTQKK